MIIHFLHGTVNTLRGQNVLKYARSACSEEKTGFFRGGSGSGADEPAGERRRVCAGSCKRQSGGGQKRLLSQFEAAQLYMHVQREKNVVRQAQRPGGQRIRQTDICGGRKACRASALPRCFAFIGKIFSRSRCIFLLGRQVLIREDHFLVSFYSCAFRRLRSRRPPPEAARCAEGRLKSGDCRRCGCSH